MAAHHCRLSEAAATAMCNTLADLVDAGTPPGFIKIFTGAEPTHCNDAAGTEVAACTLNTTAFSAATYQAGTHTSDVTLVTSATDPHAAGHANAVTYFRIVNAAGTAILQGTCSATAGDDLVLNSAIIATNSQVEITALTISVPIDQA